MDGSNLSATANSLDLLAIKVWEGGGSAVASAGAMRARLDPTRLAANKQRDLRVPLSVAQPNLGQVYYVRSRTCSLTLTVT